MRITDLEEIVVNSLINKLGSCMFYITESYDAHIIDDYMVNSTNMNSRICIAHKCNHLRYIKRKPKSFLHKLKLSIFR